MQTETEYKMEHITAKGFFDFCQDRYTEISEDDYYHMLEVLPPLEWKHHALWKHHAFMMCEFNTRSLTNMAIMIDNKYYLAVIDKHDFDNAINFFQSLTKGN